MAARRNPWPAPEWLWREFEPLIPRVERRFRYPGRKRHDDRAVFEAILYVLRYAVPWQELPRVEGWPSGQTAWRRFHEWQRAGVWERLLVRMQQLLEREGLVDWSRVTALTRLHRKSDTLEKGGAAVGRSLHGRSGSRFHLAVDAGGAPFALRIGPGNENERRQLLPLLDELLARKLKPRELWADRGYDGAQLRHQLRERGIEPMISRRRRPGEPAPPGTPTVLRGNRRRPRTPDPLGRKRWPVERTISWLRNWRRVATRWERRPELWLAVLQIAAAMTIAQTLERSFR